MQDQYNSTHAKSKYSYYGYAPNKIIKGKGCYLFDSNNNKYLDCGMALGSVSLGYAYDAVDNSVIEAIRQGINFSRPSYLEEQLTVLLREKLGFQFNVKFSKSSSMLLSVIPRVCRYLTGKTHIAYPFNGAYLGNTDWYFSKAKNSGGVLESIGDYTITFEGGCLSKLVELFDQYADKLACIVMEPFRERKFDALYYKTLSALCRKNHVLLIFDETVSGFRFGNLLAHIELDCNPNFTIVGKAIANGYALSAVLGEPYLMAEIEKATSKGKLYGFSNTHAGESIGLAAAIKTLEEYEKEKVIEHMNLLGQQLIKDWNAAIKASELRGIICVVGQPTYFHLSGNDWELVSKIRKDIIKSLYQKGILFKGTIAMSLSHKNEHILRLASEFSNYCANFKFSNLIYYK